MITAATPATRVSAMTVDWILEEQAKDDFCRRMRQHLSRHVEEDSDYESSDEESDEEPAAAEDLPADEEEPAAADKEPAAVEGEPTVVQLAKKALQKKRLKAAATTTEKRLRERVCSSAPYFALTADGMLVNLQHRRKGSDGEIAKELDMMQRIHIPTSAIELQNELIDALHTEAGHPKSLRTYQLMLQRVYLQGVFASVHERIGRCTKCQFHAARPAKAPLLGHQMATRERITFTERTL